ncbi:MAG: hypothetical protein QXL15_00315 [Candidatus Korarchaeota archaeon]
MLQGVIILDDKRGDIKYIFTTSRIDPLKIGLIGYELSKLLERIFDQELKRIELQNIQICTFRIGSHFFIIIAECGDPYPLIERFLEEVKSIDGLNANIIFNTIEHRIISAMHKYNRYLALHEINSLVSCKKIKKVIATAILTNLLDGKIIIEGVKNRELVENLIRYIKYIKNSREQSDYCCKVNCDSLSVRSNVDPRIVKIIMNYLSKGEYEKLVKLVECVFSLAAEIMNFVVDSPLEFVQWIYSRIDEYFIEKTEIIDLVVELARIHYYLPTSRYKKLVAQGRYGLFINCWSRSKKFK